VQPVESGIGSPQIIRPTSREVLHQVSDAGKSWMIRPLRRIIQQRQANPLATAQPEGWIKSGDIVDQPRKRYKACKPS
jgi:hypothetical protein